MARLDRTGDHIVCGLMRGDGVCGGRIAAIRSEKAKRVLAVLPGWDRSPDGVYHEPPNDFVRRQRGYRPRRLPTRLTGTHNRAESYLTPVFPLDGQPIMLRCPDCQVVHAIRRDDFKLGQGGEGSMVTMPNQTDR